jgi:membrane-associated phospholipid phosphatase
LKKAVFLFLCLIGLRASAQQGKDTTKKNIPDTLKKDLFTAPDTVKHLHTKFGALIPPALLVGYGASSFFIHPLRSFDSYIYSEADKHNIAPTRHLEDFFQYTPVVLVYAVNFAGVHGKNTFVDRTLIYALSEGIMELTTFTIKRTTHRLRPNQADYLSFPSGHTSNAFEGAEFMAQELGDNSIGYSIVGYAFATTTGAFRIYHQDHWFSDVVAGAGVGILSAKAAYLVYPYIRNRLFKAGREKENNRQTPEELKKKSQKESMLLPSFQGGTFGAQFSMTF